MPKALPGTRFEDTYSARQIKAIARYHLGIAKHLFIHIPKNGGLTIRNSAAMRRRVVVPDPYFHTSRAYTHALAEAMASLGTHHGNQHARLRDIAPAVRARLQAVALVRNPFSRTFSRFVFRMKHRARKGMAVDYTTPAFRAFLELRFEDYERPYSWHMATRSWHQQRDYVVDEAGELACDVLRTEHLGAEIARYFGVTELTHKNAARRDAPRYTEVYDAECTRIVADWYAADIETFGFDFEGGATRNIYYG